MNLRAAVLLLAACGYGPAAADPPAPAPAPATAPAQGPLTVDEAVAHPINWGANLSPSGRYLAIIQRQEKDNLNMIIVADLQDPAAKNLVHPVGGGVVQWVSWVSEDRLLFATYLWADRRGRPMTFEDVEKEGGRRVARLLSFDRDGKNLAMMFAGNSEVLEARDLTDITAFLRDDPRHVIAPAWQNGRLDLFKVDVYSGAAERIGRGNNGTFYWFADREGFPAFRVDRNWTGSLAYVYARKGPGNVPAGDLEWEKTMTIPLRGEQNTSTPDFYPLHAGPDDDTYYVAARPDGADTSGIYLYNFVEKKYLKTLAVVPGYDVDDMFIDWKTHEYLGIQYYAERKVTRMVDPKVQAQYDALDKYFGGEVDVYLTDYDRAAENWLLYSVGPRDRGSWHVYTKKDKFVREVAQRRPPLDVRRLGTTRVLRYRARDGLEIMGYLTTPPDLPKGATPPLVLLPHGGPEVRDYFTFDALVQLLATRGYRVFQPNFRGSSGFGKRFADAGRRQWGGTMQDDLTDALEYLVKEGLAARDRACIVGGSYGGYAALAGATLTPDLYRCAISINGVTDLPAQLKADRKTTRGDDESWDYVKKQIGDPDDDEEMLEARSPVRLASAVKIPVLLVHSELDGKVPIEQSEKMEKALRKAGKDVKLVRIADAGHGLDTDDLKKVYPPILEFLEKHLPVVPPPVAAPPPEPPKP